MEEQVIKFCFYSRNKNFAEVLGRALGPGYEVLQGDLDNAGQQASETQAVDAFLLDASSSGHEEHCTILHSLKTLLKSFQLPPPIIVMVQDDEQDIVRDFIENGAYETLASPPDIMELRLVLRRACRYHQIEVDLSHSRSRQESSGQFGELVGYSENIRQVFEMARKVAACDVNVLITGETGTGKELLARAIHRLSPRAEGPFVAFSCANLPETLVDDELFGHERGAFTGATGRRCGRFEVADQGTLLLDEIGDLAPILQAKLLRVLQEGSFERLGSNTTLSSNVRIIAATHQDLEEMVRDDRFRKDLYFRVNVIQLKIPPLRERRDDIPLLAHHFLRQYARQFGKETCRVSLPAMHALEEHSWPGNVRQLENVIQRAVVLAEGKSIEPRHLPERIHNGFLHSSASSLYEEEVQEFKRRLLLRTLRECKGNRTETARHLGVTRSGLHRLINQLNVGAQEKSREIEEGSSWAYQAPVGTRPQ